MLGIPVTQRSVADLLAVRAGAGRGRVAVQPSGYAYWLTGMGGARLERLFPPLFSLPLRRPDRTPAHNRIDPDTKKRAPSSGVGPGALRPPAWRSLRFGGH